jgi:GNAT superfamily N-acetyltransferase
VAAAPTVSVVDPEGFPALCARLGAILADAVAHGAGVNFVLPFSAADGEAYWRDRAEEVRTGARIVLVAADAAHEVVGTVSLLPAWMPNQPHRAEISKLLVHSGHRRAGVATALMRAAEDHARAIGRTLLTLDCVAGGPEEAFYVAAGYRVVGTIPGYALSPTGEPQGATFLVKDLTTGA